MHYTYLAINLGTLAVPLAFSFYRPINFYRQWPVFLPAMFITAVVYVTWDIYFTHLGIWGFNDRYITGVYIANLPVEEVLFFICIPYASIFTMHCFDLLKRPYPLYPRTEGFATAVITIVLLYVAVLHYNRLYTVTAFGFTALLLAVARYVIRVQWMGKFYAAYAVIQLPFFIVNGLLTGHWLQAPVVWYNNSENTGLRLTTIPVEDIFYGMGLLLMNNILYQYGLQRFKFVPLPLQQ
ncbi:MAG TPA: lycopene cyclase domain-containing protein [Chitinophagaceae bacterium]|nr:lycopene cyclase domain-containing protein [Chitinophagaceae bacterium]